MRHPRRSALLNLVVVSLHRGRNQRISAGKILGSSTLRIAGIGLLAALCACAAGAAAGESAAGGSANGPLLTPWGETLDKSAVLPEYPRPHMAREAWTNLNGEWDFALTPVDAERPDDFQQKILVPFPVESTLSGVAKAVTPEDAVWYRREFGAFDRDGKRLLLHFGAVDWSAKVWVNDVEVGEHTGGYDPFSFDITDALTDSGPQKLVVRVTDPTNRGSQPHGKQSLEPGGIVYTAVSGIWQTVWIEPVPVTRVRSLKVTPGVESNEVEVVVEAEGPDLANSVVRLATKSESGAPLRVTGKPGESLRIAIPKARLWSPEDPYLYDLHVDLAIESGRVHNVIDHVNSYFGMRSITIAPDEDGFSRICLNGKEYFNVGPLDQGWWPDGLYTAPSDEALKWDIEITKRFGFNTCRKHVKVEPARWYYWCDKLGLLVWQDMPCGGERGIGPSEEDPVCSAESEATFRSELKAIMDTLAHHPSVVVWAPFNEGWGQFKTNEILRWVKEYDPTRLVDGPSGWADRGYGDLLDKHDYPGPSMPPATAGRAAVLGEFGGLGLAIANHIWLDVSNWGYQSYDTKKELASSYRSLINNLWLLKRQGLSAAIYTQTTDVEGEVNGLVTYDRKVLKIDPEKAAEWNTRLYGPAPKLITVLATSQDPSAMGAEWNYSTSQPTAEDWTASGYDDSQWQVGRAGFGTPNTPSGTVRTEWDTADIWLRRTVQLDAPQLHGDLYLLVHHDEDAEIYLDGQLIKSLSGFTVDYTVVSLSSESRRLLTPGKHVIAIHCRQTDGGQYVDLGLVAVQTAAAEKDDPLSLSEAADRGPRKR